MIVNTSTQHHCYGDEQRNWHCNDQPDNKKITTVIPTRRPQVTVHVPDSGPATDEPLIADAGPAPVQGTITEAESTIAGQVEQPSAIESESIVLAAPPSSFAVQLIAMETLDPVLTYAQQVGIDEPFYMKIINEGEVWYVLLLGIYPTADAAQSAKDAWIGTRVLKVQPWVRNIAPLQDAIRLTQSAS